MEHLGAPPTAASKNVCTAARSAASKAMCASRAAPSVVTGPIQNRGCAVPQPITWPKSSRRVLPSGASTRS
ncbi:hypothetical protein ACFWU3_01620 [Streptomyces sp. NPDC058685]|uniref:hypothetical protein n=1 Tax=Streptomyces sp. NPDC058685 TaxID=3346598 RepID=UPI003662D5FC